MPRGRDLYRLPWYSEYVEVLIPFEKESQNSDGRRLADVLARVRRDCANGASRVVEGARERSRSPERGDAL